jgi:phage terminase large subunit
MQGIAEKREAAFQIPEAFAYLLKPKRYKGAYGGRGSAKSWSVARLLIGVKAMENTITVLCAREYMTTIKQSVKQLLDDTIEELGLGWFYTSTQTEIKGANGSRFIFAGLKNDPDKIKSMEGVNICWVEEANNVSAESLKVLKPTIREEGSEIWFTYNRKRADEPVHELSKRPDADFRLINHDQNPFFPKVLRTDMEYDRSHDPEMYQHVWEGEPLVHSAAQVFKGKYRVEEFVTPDDARLYFGADWGFSVDPSTLVRFWVDKDKRTIYVDYEAYQVGVEIDKLPDLFDTVPLSRKGPIIADSARPETISYMKRQGFKIRGAKKGPNSVEEGVNFLKSYTIIIHPRCKRTTAEFGMYSYKVDKLSGDVLPQLEDAHNHIIDPMRYGLEGVRRGRLKVN